MRFTGLDAISVEPYLDLIRPEVAFSYTKYGNGVLLAGCHSQTIIIEMRFTGLDDISVEPHLKKEEQPQCKLCTIFHTTWDLIRSEVVFSDNNYEDGVYWARCHLC